MKTTAAYPKDVLTSTIRPRGRIDSRPARNDSDGDFYDWVDTWSGNVDQDRRAKVKEGLQSMLAAVDADPFAATGRASESIHRTLQAHERCGNTFSWREYEHSCGTRVNEPTTMPCHFPGCERCGSHRRGGALLKNWRDQFLFHYHAQPMVIRLQAPWHDRRRMRLMIDRLKRRKAVQRILGAVVGLVTALPEGHALDLVLRSEDAGQIPALRRAWEELAPGGIVEPRDVEGSTDALEVTVELLLQSEQALPLLVAHGAMDPGKAHKVRERELEDKTHGFVHFPGFRTLPAEWLEDEDPGPEPGNAGQEPPEDGEGTDAEGCGCKISPILKTHIGEKIHDEEVESVSHDPFSLDDGPGSEAVEHTWESPPAPGRCGCGDPGCKRRATGRTLFFWQIQRMAEYDELQPVFVAGRVVAYRSTNGRDGR